MPPRKKATGTLTSVDENHLSKPSADRISMHSKGIESFGEASHPKNRNIMATIKDLQHSQAAMYRKKCDHHTIDCYALRNIFHDRVVKGDLFIKVGKRANPRMCRPEVAMTFFIGREDPMEKEAENMASSSLAPLPLVNEEMVTRIQQEDKIHSFLEGIGLRQMARREAA
nr:hypothetical protein CFP56_25642 [Quercus suber]